MADVALAFLWHQHQPYYPDDVAGDNPMPWVRLHGVKDYYGMALHLLEFPEMRCTINLVPSLILQIQGYTERGATDQLLKASRIPADGLREEDCLFLLDNFFMANPEHMIRPFPRYFELHQRRGFGKNTAQEALKRFNDKDFRDLQTWFNLTWVHPLAFEKDANLRELADKGRNFSEEEKTWLLDKHLEILREILPLHRRLADSGQIELTTTPCYHPILPLLFDKKLAREAMPDVKLPRYTGGYHEDAAIHVSRAVVQHTALFGKPPIGMWPAEGSVCQAMLPLLAQHGIRWIATDEEILRHSTQGFVSRDQHGHVVNPEHMYRAYKVREGEAELDIVFRDHALSDMIGFHYQRSDPVTAAQDFVSHLQNIGKAVGGHEPALVSVILDGENCWEHYPGGGVMFLRELYRRCTTTAGVRSVALGDFLENNPPRDTLPHLFAGSWISHNFAIWIGHEEDNTAWDALHRAREHLRERSHAVLAPPEKLRQAWEELYIAEGSDWFWWYGDDHSSAQDALFDYLFRKHLQNIYTLLGDTPPADLSKPISKRVQRPTYSLPRALLDVHIDGLHTFFEWTSAGHYPTQTLRGTMTEVTPRAIKEIFFGFSLDALFIRLDLEGRAKQDLQDFTALRINFAEPADWQVLITWPADASPKAELLHTGKVQRQPGAATIAVGLDKILETSIPFDLLGVKVGEPVQFFMELLEGTQSRDRVPREGAIQLTRPGPDFELRMWDV
ncbi:MAG TPA: glycoside hydrolase family 57 protein [Gemmataceae bacterium]|nr:glycoside hydrolase family 57 protein [Gemmataceae bacterium]